MSNEQEILEAFLKLAGFKATIKATTAPEGAGEWEKGANAYRVTLKRESEKMTFHYYQGKGIKEAPRLSDVVYSLISDRNTLSGAQTLQEWGNCFGWDENTVKTYEAVVKQTKEFEKLVGSKSLLGSLCLFEL